MKDRIPTYPGRVTLTPVSGQTDTYTMEKADSPTVEGTALNKANLLTDATATQLGLTSADPTVNEALAAATPLNMHLWHRRTASFGLAMGEEMTWDNGGKQYDGAVYSDTIYYTATTPTVDELGVITATGTQVKIYYSYALSNPDILKNKYFWFGGSTSFSNIRTLYYCTGSMGTQESGYHVTIPCKICTAAADYGTWSEIFSSNASLYTPGIANGYENRLTNAYETGTRDACRWARGFYTGSGSTTASHTIVTIQPDFAPQLLIMKRVNSSDVMLIALRQESLSPLTIIWNGNTVTVKDSGTAAVNDYDKAGYNYCWIAMG